MLLLKLVCLNLQRVFYTHSTKIALFQQCVVFLRNRRRWKGVELEYHSRCLNYFPQNLMQTKIRSTRPAKALLKNSNKTPSIMDKMIIKCVMIMIKCKNEICKHGEFQKLFWTTWFFKSSPWKNFCIFEWKLNIAIGNP